MTECELILKNVKLLCPCGHTAAKIQDGEAHPVPQSEVTVRLTTNFPPNLGQQPGLAGGSGVLNHNALCLHSSHSTPGIIPNALMNEFTESSPWV